MPTTISALLVYDQITLILQNIYFENIWSLFIIFKLYMTSTKLKNCYVNSEFSFFRYNLQMIISLWDLWNKQATVSLIKT